MAQDKPTPRAQGSFSLDDPTQALIQDHNYVRLLFQHYLSTQDAKVKQQAGPQICDALRLHTSVEDAVFYPGVQSVDTALVDQCEADHQQAEAMLDQLQALQPGESSYDELMQQLRDAIVAHIDIEEQQLFPAVRQSTLDLQDLALKMQGYESNLLSTQARGRQGTQPGGQTR